MKNIKTLDDLFAFLKKQMRYRFNGEIKIIFDWGTIIELHKSTDIYKVVIEGNDSNGSSKGSNGHSNGNGNGTKKIAKSRNSNIKKLHLK